MDQEAIESFQAQAHLYKHIFNYISSMSLKCDVQLGISDVIHNHGQPITLSKLVSALGVDLTKVSFTYLLMRVLVHLGFFATTTRVENDQEHEAYVLTPFSKILIKEKVNCLSPFVVSMLSLAIMNSFQLLGDWIQGTKERPFETVNGKTFWEYMEHDSEFKTLFNDAMQSDSQMINFYFDKCGLGLVFSNEYNNPNIVGSSSLPLFNTKPMSPLSFSSKKKGPGEMEFVEDMGGGVDDGLVSCTENLGFESFNDDSYTEFCEEEIKDRWRNKKRRGEEKRSEDKRNKKFPPPLPSLNQNGQPCFYLRPVRENGRLELTEI
ncbi:hypothetical protein HRI_000089900 [Hibiscus trionum]|uniref:Uncharacterized protein n=1 Tax=Hibiscus trionum TaxID=183268 RepID=A0A9W7LHD6_HIBTR|nr:hypothetical protein HRI_000089900 [Hibiscus trionum]